MSWEKLPRMQHRDKETEIIKRRLRDKEHRMRMSNITLKYIQSSRKRKQRMENRRSSKRSSLIIFSLKLMKNIILYKGLWYRYNNYKKKYSGTKFSLWPKIMTTTKDKICETIIKTLDIIQ